MRRVRGEQTRTVREPVQSRIHVRIPKRNNQENERKMREQTSTTNANEALGECKREFRSRTP